MRRVLSRCLGSAVFFWGGVAFSQAPAPASASAVPAAAPASVESPPPATPAPPITPPPAAPSELPPAPPPLDPPPPPRPEVRPAFLHPLEGRPAASEPGAAPAGGSQPGGAPAFIERASPWVDLVLTSFWLDNRYSNFLNFGAQVGCYCFGRLRLSARVMIPLGTVGDDYRTSIFSEPPFRQARNVSFVYTASVGLVVTNSRSFVFGPSVVLQRADVEAYGSELAFALPFEWTQRKNMRTGFEFSLGHAFGGSVADTCTTASSPGCATFRTRPSGTSILAQFNLGWALGGL